MSSQAYEYLWGRLHNLLGQPAPVLTNPPSKKKKNQLFSDVFQLMLIASGPITGHHWQEPGSVLFALSLQVFRHIDEILLPEPSLLQAEESQLSQHFLIMSDVPVPSSSLWPFPSLNSL